MKTVDQRLSEAERTIAQLLRDTARKPAREAAPLAPRHGKFLGITREDFTQGVDDFFSVDVWIWSETDQEWRKVPDLIIEARDWFLNDGEEVQKETKVKVEWYETTWVVTAMYCSPTDLDAYKSLASPGAEIYTGSPGGSPSYDGGSSGYAESYGGSFDGGGGYALWD